MPTNSSLREYMNSWGDSLAPITDSIQTTPHISQNTEDLYRYIASLNGPASVAVSQKRTSAPEPAAAVVPPSESGPDAAYAALAADLGLNPLPIDAERFKGFLSEAGLRVYARDQVQEYLHFKYQVPVGNVTSLVQWGWRPLREQDRTNGHKDSKNGSLQRGAPTYAKPIPYPVLLTIKSIRDQFPTAKFFVSDEMHAERIPDPFLLVELGAEQAIVERWDEPKFRG